MAKIKLKGISYEIKRNKAGDVVIDKASNKWRMNLTKNSGVKTIAEGIKSAKAFADRFMDEKGRTYGDPPRPISQVKKKKEGKKK